MICSSEIAGSQALYKSNVCICRNTSVLVVTVALAIILMIGGLSYPNIALVALSTALFSVSIPAIIAVVVKHQQFVRRCKKLDSEWLKNHFSYLKTHPKAYAFGVNEAVVFIKNGDKRFIVFFENIGASAVYASQLPDDFAWIGIPWNYENACSNSVSTLPSN